jgi:malate dehydrogenase (oxaloacetate-decarboxylating)
MDYAQKALDAHAHHQGKLAVHSKVTVGDKEALSTYYTPGVAAPCLAIQKNPDSAYTYTWKSNSVAVISDGSAVLWLWNIWWIAGLPVMEGKAILFKQFANIDAVPIILNTQDPDQIIQTISNIAPWFGGINLEDIKAPECFYIENALKGKLNIPVFHDDQHGTAIVVLAWLINALKLAEKNITEIQIVIAGAGAAGIAIAKLLQAYGANNIIMTDSKGIIYKDRTDLNQYKKEVAERNKNNISGTLQTALQWSDVFIGVSQPNILTATDIETMADKSIIFAMSNPTPEIHPNQAKEGGAYIIATGRSDFPNQINNLLAFPGIFRGALDARIQNIETKHKLAAAQALAQATENINTENIIPSVFQPWIANIIAEAVKQAGL